MDYKAAGAPKPAKGNPRHSEHNARGTAKNPLNRKDDKSALLARMKAAAEQSKKD
ncbi:hypothetical protein [Aliiroseovarius sp. S1123]|jgi:hypothetical protein|uniref:hypothetical protein n=1 Tax=unclassified Aliiroseovarius TaxID=2623558 RepID=UPI001FF2B9E8|nr:hypothetical protein [Aliiroseovarius sp. S1123]MCK0171645.1 hypothetical protein [Aliiroseovarius sp. S1123]